VSSAETVETLLIKVEERRALWRSINSEGAIVQLAKETNVPPELEREAHSTE
jgi:hypothetical protein